MLLELADRSLGREPALDLHCTGRGELQLAGSAFALVLTSTGRFLGRTGKGPPCAGHMFSRQSVLQPRGSLLGPLHADILDNACEGFWHHETTLGPTLLSFAPLACSFASNGIFFCYSGWKLLLAALRQLYH